MEKSFDERVEDRVTGELQPVDLTELYEQFGEEWYDKEEVQAIREEEENKEENEEGEEI